MKFTTFLHNGQARLGVVDGNDLPYLPEALEKREENQQGLGVG